MPVTPTYVPLAEVTLAATTASVTLPVPTGYRDLILVSQARTDRSGSYDDDIYCQLNGDTGSNYSNVWMMGNGSATDSATASGSYIRIFINAPASLATAGVFGNFIASFQDASATDKHKTILTRSNEAVRASTYAVAATASRWSNTAAITSMRIYSGTGANLVSGTTLNLYGIEA